MQTIKLTPRQMQLLNYIAKFKSSRCYSPTIAELASKLQISRSTVFEHIAELRKKGFLSASPGKARSLKITSKAQKLLNKITTQNTTPDTRTAHTIPLVGNVAAGAPIEAIEEANHISMDSHFGNGEIFALRVQGESMIDDGIQNGDHVICRKTVVADNGQLVIAIVDNENATLKRFYKERTSVRLQPANNSYQPIYSDNCRIEAVVVGLIRKF